MEESLHINEMILNLMSIKRKHALPIIREGQQQEVFTNTISAEDMMHIIIGAFRLQIFRWRAKNFEFNIEKRGKELIESLLTLITTKTS